MTTKSVQQIELAEHRRKVVRQMTLGGSTAREIARELGISWHTARNIRHRIGVLSREASQPVTAEQEQRIQQMAQDGVPINEIAKTLGLSHPAVKKRVPWAVWDTKQVAEWAAFHRKPNRGKGRA